MNNAHEFQPLTAEDRIIGEATLARWQHSIGECLNALGECRAILTGSQPAAITDQVRIHLADVVLQLDALKDDVRHARGSRGKALGERMREALNVFERPAPKAS